MSVKIGLVGCNVASGLGEVNRQLVKYAGITHWLIKPHSKYEMRGLPENVECTIGEATGSTVEDFVKSVDVVLFAEVPHFSHLIDLCVTHGKRIVCVPMLEWTSLGSHGWLEQVNLFICPTQQCYDQLGDNLPRVSFSWPVDVNRYKFDPRITCDHFLFINGHGGWKGRKGFTVIRKALELWPEMPLLIHDQTATDWGIPVLDKVKDNDDLYNQGDVLIAPHSVDGIGLECMEAMVCGMPVISTDGEPWREYPAMDRIRAVVTKQQVRRPMDWYLPDPEHLVSICKSWLGKDISEHSLQGREWAEDNDWSHRAKSFVELVTSYDAKDNQVTESPLPNLPVAPPPFKGRERWDKFLFTEAIQALDKIGGKVIVELGAIRDLKPAAEHADGWSTVRWAQAGRFEVYCIDNDSRAIASAQKLVPTGVHYHCRDGFKFLREFEGSIDLLYLDGPDAEKGGTEFHLKALKMAPLSGSCLVLMDDCDLWPGRWVGRGKGELAIPEALRMGFDVLHDNGRQVLLGRGIV
jgi:hypothetical protein